MYANEMCKSTQNTQSEKDVSEAEHEISQVRGMYRLPNTKFPKAVGCIPHVRRMCLKPYIKYSRSEKCTDRRTQNS